VRNETDFFHAVIEEIKQLKTRAQISISEIPAPQRLAPFAYAISADLVDGDIDVATGRFVLLHDPEGQEAWEGKFRCVTFVRSALETEMESDPLLPDVGWSWFIDALNNLSANYLAPSGTVTPQDESSEIEIRASWTPADPKALINHVNAWLELMASAAGLPPVPEGVATLPAKR
jgi:hypothetical protein